MRDHPSLDASSHATASSSAFKSVDSSEEMPDLSGFPGDALGSGVVVYHLNLAILD